ncbi:uncharacterized protein LOC110449208 [Mizuhopecten yessoensis]|uniref:uncharacterized protein LOC110449208 n=1 Tax=Mizuhopecten yessoensis TaxID=6573 RepID=UPI000B45B541|nr:uncharacterized protein LOC110449208 [Mizuhopecten yessoensis]
MHQSSREETMLDLQFVPVIGCESWLSSNIKDSEVFPEGFTVFRKDRNHQGGGVFICIKDCFSVSEIPDPDCNSELLWVEVQLKGAKKVRIGSYYRPPATGEDYIRGLESSINKITNSSYKHLLLAGDFNLPHINWNSSSVTPGATQSAVHNIFLDTLDTFSLTNVQKQPSRNGNVLDLYITSNPSLVKHVQTIPGISDHDMVTIDEDIKPVYHKKMPRKVLMYKNVDWKAVKEDATNLSDKITNSSDSVEENWTEFKNGLNSIIDERIPSKLTSTKPNQLPWVGRPERRLIKRKHRLYNKARKSGKDADWRAYRVHKRETQKALRTAEWSHLERTLQAGIEQKNNKPFWRYIKARKQDNIGIAPLKEGNKLLTDSTDKAEALNRQFRSVFTKEPPDPDLPPLTTSKYPIMRNLIIDEKGVEKLIREIKVSKASGPDNLANRVLQQCSNELAPAMTHISKQSILTGELPDDWRNANITPIFKKGNRH